MKSRGRPAPDPMTLARLHAALDAVTDTEQMIAQIQASSASSQPGVVRVGQLVAEARELLRLLLARPVVGTPGTRRESDGW